MPILNDNELKEKLVQLLQTVLQQDKELREQFQIGDKFRFIRDRLNALFTNLESSLKNLEQKEEKKTQTITEDETTIYVYLFNAQGLVLQTWKKMVNASVFYDHSINRPVYAEKSYIESFIRGKTNKAQHGYLSVIIKKQDILPPKSTDPQKDAIGNPFIKIKEGSLQFKKLISFTHNGNDFAVNEDGELVKK